MPGLSTPLAGTAIAGAALVVTAFVHLTLTDGADHHFSAAAMRTLNALDADTWVAFNSGFGVMMLGAAGSLLPHPGGYRWFGRIAVLLGIALFIPYADFIGLLGTLVWIIAMSFALLRSPKEAGHTIAPHTA